MVGWAAVATAAEEEEEEVNGVSRGRWVPVTVASGARNPTPLLLRLTFVPLLPVVVGAPLALPLVARVTLVLRRA